MPLYWRIKSQVPELPFIILFTILFFVLCFSLINLFVCVKLHRLHPFKTFWTFILVIIINTIKCFNIVYAVPSICKICLLHNQMHIQYIWWYIHFYSNIFRHNNAIISEYRPGRKSVVIKPPTIKRTTHQKFLHLAHSAVIIYV